MDHPNIRFRTIITCIWTGCHCCFFVEFRSGLHRVQWFSGWLSSAFPVSCFSMLSGSIFNVYICIVPYMLQLFLCYFFVFFLLGYVSILFCLWLDMILSHHFFVVRRQNFHMLSLLCFMQKRIKVSITNWNLRVQSITFKQTWTEKSTKRRQW